MVIGVWQLILILLIVLLLFGSGRLSTIMTDFAKGIKEMRNVISDEKSEQKKQDQKTTTSEKENGDS